MNYEEKRLKAWQRAGINIESYGQYVELYNLAGGKCEVCETPLSLGNEPEHEYSQPGFEGHLIYWQAVKELELIPMEVEA